MDLEAVKEMRADVHNQVIQILAAYLREHAAEGARGPAETGDMS